MFKLSLSPGLWSLESSSMAVVTSGVVCLAETRFGMTPVVLRRHHYNGPGGSVPKPPGAMNSSVGSPEWCSVLRLCCVAGERTDPQP